MIAPCAALTPAFWEALRFLSKVDFSGECWTWKACVNADSGYGRFRFKGKTEFAHRAAHRLFIGPIPSGFTVDHVKKRGCERRSCVRFHHLEAVTNADNIRRAPNANRNKTHCPRGHEYTPDNTYSYPGQRYCKSCLLIRSKGRKNGN